MSPFPPEPLNTASSGSIAGKWSEAPLFERTDTDDLARLLMAEWGEVEGLDAQVLGVSYVASWADVARAVLAAGYIPPSTLAEREAAAVSTAVSAERERIAAAIENMSLGRPVERMGARMDWIAYTPKHVQQAAARAARTAPLQDAEPTVTDVFVARLQDAEEVGE